MSSFLSRHQWFIDQYRCY